MAQYDVEITPGDAGGAPAAAVFTSDDLMLMVQSGGFVIGDLSQLQTYIESQQLDPSTATVLRDDFLFASTETGEIGDLGWGFTNGTWNLINPVAGYPGIARRASTAVSGTVASIFTGGGGTSVVIRWDQFDEQTWVIRPVTADADYDIRVGLFSDLTADPPSNGVYVERLAADAAWYGVTRAGGTQTRSASLGAFAADWVKIKIRRIDATTVGFTVDGGTEVTQTANVIGDTTVAAFGAQVIPKSANARSVDFDFFSQRLTAQAR